MLNGVFSYVFLRRISTVTLRRFSRWQVSSARKREYQRITKFSMFSVLSVLLKIVLFLNANRDLLDRFWLPRKVRFSTYCKVFVLVPTAVLRPTEKMETTADVQLPVLRPKNKKLSTSNGPSIGKKQIDKKSHCGELRPDRMHTRGLLIPHPVRGIF